MTLLSSAKNPRIKELARLRSDKSASWPNGFSVEGSREISRAIAQGFEVIELFHSDGPLPSDDQKLLQSLQPHARFPIWPVAAGVFSGLVMRSGSVGVLAVLRQRSVRLEEFQPRPPALLMALQSVEKPGNIGALLRSADGAGADGLIVFDHTTNPFHHNIVRASTGALFSVPIIKSDENAFTTFCQDRGIALIAASPEATKPYFEADLTRPLCFVLGSEDKGLGNSWRAGNFELVSIPMSGLCDSLNVSVTGALLFYETLRQRLSRKAQRQETDKELPHS